MSQHEGKPTPSVQQLTADAAVRWGHLFVTLPVLALMLGLWGLASVLFRHGRQLSGLPASLQVAIAVTVAVGPPAAAWLWWAFAVPRWRYGALSRGADPELLQALGQAQGLVWPQESFLTRTEFRYPSKR